MDLSSFKNNNTGQKGSLITIIVDNRRLQLADANLSRLLGIDAATATGEA